MLDLLFDVLRHPYRRRILTRLHERNPRDEAEFSPDALAVEDDEVELLAIELHHKHLPKLAEAEFVDWDREANVVTRGPRFHEIEPLIELIVEHSEELPAGWP